MPPGRRSRYARAHPPWSGPCGGAQSLQGVMLCVVLGVIVLSGVVSAQSAHDVSSSFSSTNAVHYLPPEPSLLSNATVTGEVLLRPVLRSPSSTDSERSDLLPADDMADVVNVVFKGEKGVVDGLKDWLDSKTSLSIVMGICGGIIAVSIALFILCFCLRDREDLPFSLPFIGEGDDGGGGGGGGGGKMKVISGAAPKAGTCKLTMIACDIENSWMLWNMRPETFEEIEADYKREMRNSLIMHNCFEFRQVGTMFLITSNSPLSALQWATAMQQYFPSDTAQTPHVRMGIHLAECKVKIDKKTGDYEIQGPLTDIAQRTMLEAQPGHAWVTEATHDALGEGDLEVIDLQAIGERDLPGLRKSISMYQLLCGPGAREYDPPEPTSPEVVSPEESEEPASPQPGGGRPKALDVHKLNNEDTPNFEDSIYGGKATEALQTKKPPPPTAPTEPAERPRKAPPKIERKMKVRGEVGDPAVVRWKNAAGEVDPVRFIHGTPSISGDKIQRCFAEGNGLLFRINDTVNGKWAFYNDTLNFNMRVGMTCSKNSEFVALGSAKFTEDPVSGQYIGELIIPPLKTEPLLAGTVGRYKLMYSAAPSQGFDPSKIRNPLDGDEEQKHSAR